MSFVDRLKLLAVTSGGLGLSPVAPGTVGTLGGVAIAWGLSGTQNYLLWTVLCCVGLYALGRSLGDWAERYAGGKDPGFFVLDEVIGYLVTCAWLRGPSTLGLVVAFLAFRVFDIAKPPPVKRFERLGGGDGILLDDVVAGGYGLLTMIVLRAAFLEPETWFV